ncbi:zinc finger protein 384b isoform X3 [Triplophysa dalaica]|uniref:zinc finger protein 384b isoform X3 n=1 Tax=Triplophysa dalaica TaxID=1582913 RepID=UPI0024DF3ABF|nr:zinc finger protein 384b isoform X3 [Triplophysa dalaica]
MEDHFNSSYFWSPVQGQIENAIFLNKVKEQLGQDKSPTYSHSPAHNPATGVAGGVRTLKQEQMQPSHSSHSITVVPVPSTHTGIMTAAGLVTFVSPVSSAQSLIPGHPSTTMITVQTDKKNESVACSPVVIPITGKRGRKKKSTLSLVGSTSGADPLILGLAGQHHSANLYSLYPEQGHVGKEAGKTYRNHTETKPHKCPHCTKSFANTSYLAQHVRIHTGAKPYGCSFCQKSFRQLSHLQQHHRIHTGDRPYKCTHPGCEKSFTQLSNLQSHRRQHNKDKPYKCHHCNRGYVDAASLEVHLSTHTVKHAKLYSCGLCNRTYTSETYLMKHLHKHAPDLVQSPLGSTQPSHSPGRTGGGDSDEDKQSQAERSDSFGLTTGVPFVFDLNPYKLVTSSDVQYKTVSVSDISPHKDLCITVEASAIQVEHLNS